MSPEQAKGKPADRRSDIWAFGCVLYEMLTGTRAFEGDDVADTLAAVLRHEPDWDRVPARARRIVRWCLEKDPQLRLRDAEDAWRLLEQDASSSPAVTTSEMRRRRAGVWLFAAVALLVIGGITIAALRQPTGSAASMRLGIELPENTSVSSFALSPDGRRLAVVLIGIDSGKRQLWLRALDSPDFELLTGTDTAQYPFWSPDGRSIGFFADGKLKTISTSGGPPQVLCEIGPVVGSGGTWNRGGVILFSPAPLAAPLKRVLATGGDCVPITNPEPGMSHRFPEFLPDGNHFFYRADFGVEAKRGVYLASLDRPTEPRLVLRDESSIAFAPSLRGSSGHMLFIRNQTLMAQRFDTRTLQLDGEPMRLAEHASFSVTGITPQVGASASATGVLVYLSNRTGESELAWVDRTGHELTRLIPRGMQRAVALAPGGTMTALVTAEGITLRDLGRGVETRFTFPPGRAADPVWSPDGQHLAFSTGQDLYVKNATDGTSQVLLLRGNEPVSPSDWSHDGRFLIYTAVDAKAGKASLWLMPDPAKPGEHESVKLSGDGNFTESQAQISPDGRWVAYTSDESGAPAIYVRAFPSGAGKWRVSPDRAVQPRWRADGRELFYMQGSAVYRWMAVPVGAGPGGIFESGEPRILFMFGAIASGPQTSLFNYSPADDGQRFLVNISADQRPAMLNVITNWDAVPNDR
jgi:Tol biopolymer transport system component